jgi:hypothetical protein
MNTSNFFSPQRFFRFLKSDLLLNQKRYLFAVLGAAIGIYLLLLFMMATNHGRFNDYLGAFIMCSFGLGAFIGNAFPDLNDKIKTANYILYPASTFEKVLSQFLMYVVFGSLFFLGMFWIDAHLARWTMFLKESVQTGEYVIGSFKYSMILENNMPIETAAKILVILLIWNIGVFLFAARLFFRRFALVKTVITGIALFALGACLMVLFSHLFFPETNGFNIESRGYKVVGEIYNVMIFAYALELSWLFFLPFAYFKLKEKQI